VPSYVEAERADRARATGSIAVAAETVRTRAETRAAPASGGTRLDGRPEGCHLRNPEEQGPGDADTAVRKYVRPRDGTRE
jgi:hypothetical protein